MDRAEVQVREVERGITTGPAGIVRASLTHTETYLTKVNNKGDMYNGTREQSEHVIPHLRLDGRLRKRKRVPRRKRTGVLMWIRGMTSRKLLMSDQWKKKRRRRRRLCGQDRRGRRRRKKLGRCIF